MHAGFLGAAIGGAVTIPVIGNALASGIEDLVDRGAVDWGDVAKDATWGAVFGLGKKLGKLIPDSVGQNIVNALLYTLLFSSICTVFSLYTVHCSLWQQYTHSIML